MLRELLLIAVVVFAFLGGFFLGIDYAISFSSETKSIYAVAVTSNGGGALVTILGRLTPGYGRVFVSVEPKMELDTQESAETAVYVAQRIAGVPLGFRDILFEIKAPSAIVEGPSAGAAMTILAYSLLTGKEPSKDVVITGAINPDGTIGPVGGLIQKLKACAENHIKIFLIPKGERYYEYLQPYKQTYEPFPGVYVVRTGYIRKRVDLVALGQKLGVKVIEVGRIEEALPYFFKNQPSS